MSGNGYCGYSMSNNAVDAYNDGEKPLSKWTKAVLLDAVQAAVEAGEVIINFNFDLLKKVKVAVLKKELLYNSSWHHTSSFYNKTEFYSLDLEKLEQLTEIDIKNFLEVAPENPEKKEEPTEQKCICSFLVWSGTRKHPKATERTEEGVIIGGWFYLPNGTKKKTTANGFKIIKNF